MFMANKIITIFHNICTNIQIHTHTHTHTPSKHKSTVISFTWKLTCTIKIWTLHVVETITTQIMFNEILPTKNIPKLDDLQ